MRWIWWAPFGAAVLHIFEEFVFPGGFPEWDRKYRPAIRASITPRFHVVINAVLLVVCAAVAVARGTAQGVAAWLTVAALLAANAVFHLLGMRRTRSYSPGIVTAWALYVPMAAYGFRYFIRSGQASLGTAISAAVIGASYHLWASMMHRARA